MPNDKEKVYIETTIISYFTSRPNRDLVIAGRQEITRESWSTIADKFERYVSALVIQEISQGDSEKLKQRIDVLEGIPIVAIDEISENLAATLIHEGPIPDKCIEDALHIALATTNGMDYLLTWNFSHINNAQMKHQITRLVEKHGYVCPVICTPDELVGDE